jgi:lambda family phage portal protein
VKLFGWLRKPKNLAYEAAGSGRRLQSWWPSTESLNTQLFHSGDVLRARSRDMARKSPYAANAIEAIVANAVGSGIKPQSKIVDAALRQRVQELWLAWTDEADADDRTDFYGLQALLCRAMVEGGECLGRFRVRRPEDGLSVPLQLQLLEAEHLDTSANRSLPNGNVIKGGIELNRLGQREAYHLFREHPGESAGSRETVRVPASEILHVFKPLRPGQLRGEPWLARILVKLHELDQYDDAELVRKKTAAMFAGFITKNDPEAQVMGEGQPDDKGIAQAGLEPGTMQVLEPGEDVKFSEPGDVGGSYEAFLRQQLRMIAVGMGITYEQLTSDLTGVNYSSIRAGLIEFRRRCETLQHQVLVYQFCRPVWRRWFELAVLAGNLPITATAFQRDCRAYLNAKWIPQGWDWVDPLKDQQAEQLAVRNGFKSRSEVVSSLGYDAEEIDAEIASDNARADTLGLVFDSDPRKAAKTGVLQQTATSQE